MGWHQSIGKFADSSDKEPIVTKDEFYKDNHTKGIVYQIDEERQRTALIVQCCSFTLIMGLKSQKTKHIPMELTNATFPMNKHKSCDKERSFFPSALYPVIM